MMVNLVTIFKAPSAITFLVHERNFSPKRARAVHVQNQGNQCREMVYGLQEGIVAEIHSLVGAVQHNGRYVQEILRYMLS